MRNRGQYVYVVKKDKTVELRTVNVDRTSGTETVVKDGIAAGDTVVTDGQLRLLPGSRISIKGARYVGRSRVNAVSRRGIPSSAWRCPRPHGTSRRQSR